MIRLFRLICFNFVTEYFLMKKTLLLFSAIVLTTITYAQSFSVAMSTAYSAPMEDGSADICFSYGQSLSSTFELGVGIGVGLTFKNGTFETSLNQYETYRRTGYIPLFTCAKYTFPQNPNLHLCATAGYNIGFGKRSNTTPVLPTPNSVFTYPQTLCVSEADYGKGLNQTKNGLFLGMDFCISVTRHIDVCVHTGVSSWQKSSLLKVLKVDENGNAPMKQVPVLVENEDYTLDDWDPYTYSSVLDDPNYWVVDHYETVPRGDYKVIEYAEKVDDNTYRPGKARAHLKPEIGLSLRVNF